MPNRERHAHRAEANRRQHRYLLGIILVVLGLALGVGVGEVLLRRQTWVLPYQKVHGFGLHLLDGAPVWEVTDDRQNRECVEQHPERTRILFFGSSISYGFNLTAAETFTTALQARLNELRPKPGFCVLNFAQSGFAFQQKFATAKVEIPRYRPALIMWEDWDGEWHDYQLIDDTGYGVHDLHVRSDGFFGVAYVPDALNRFLFRHSRLYEFLVMVYGESVVLPERGPNGITVFANERLSQVSRLAESVGARLVLYLAAPLDRPFADTVASPPEWHLRLTEYAEENRIPVYPLERDLVDQDYTAVRFDPCCHLNAAGHRALVPIMERIVLEQMDSSGGDHLRRIQSGSR